MGRTEQRALDSAYHLALSAFRQGADTDQLAALRDLGARPAEQFARLNILGPELIGKAMARCDAAVETLLDAHRAAGDRDPEAVAGRIIREYLNVSLAVLPGAGMYVSLRGNTAGGLRIRAESTARFEMQKSNLMRAVAHRARIKLVNAPSRVELALERLKRSRPILVVGTLVAVGAAIRGPVTWLYHRLFR